MLERIIRASIAHRWLVLILVLALSGLGVWNYSRLPIDAVPDIANVQVQINTEAPGYSPLEAEQRVTFPVETALAGLAKLDYTRSISRYGLSQVTAVFEDGTDIYFARQQVAERLQQAASQLPTGLEPTLGPVATGLGEIFMYTLEPEAGFEETWTPTALRTLQEQEPLRREALSAAQRTAQQQLNRYREGQVGFTEVVTAQASALSAQRALLQLQVKQDILLTLDVPFFRQSYGLL